MTNRPINYSFFIIDSVWHGPIFAHENVLPNKQEINHAHIFVASLIVLKEHWWARTTLTVKARPW